MTTGTTASPLEVESRQAPASPWWIAHGDAILVRLAFVLTFAAYARTIIFDFVFDDHLQIQLNPWIQAWRFVPHYFTGHVWNFQQPAWAGNYYRPLFLLYLRTVNAVFGLTPAWWHLMSIATHLVATWLVYRIGVRLFRTQTAAAVAAMVFGVYPVHIEAVAWVSGVTETLVAIFMLASFLAYLKWRDGEKTWLAASVAFFLLGLTAKETAGVLPGIILAYEILFPRNRSADAGNNPGQNRASPGHPPIDMRGIAVLIAPYAAVTAAYLATRMLVFRGIVSPQHHRPLASVILTWPKILWDYLGLLAWPFRLNAYYDDFGLVKSFSSSNFLWPTIGLVLLIGGFVVLFRRSRAMLFAGIAVLLPLVPVVVGSVVFQMHDFIHDRFLYVPSVGLAFMLAAIFVPPSAEVAGGCPACGLVGVWQMGFRRLRVGGGLALGVVLMVATILQTAPWDNDLALFWHARRQAPHNVRAIEGLAEVYGIQGDLDTAIRIQAEAVQEKPDYWAGICNLGVYYYRAARYPEAEKTLVRAISAWPAQIQPMSGTQFYYLGMARMEMGRPADAEAPLSKAVELRPDSPGYHFAYGMALKQLGKPEAAATEFRAEAVNRKKIDDAMKALGTDVVQ
ncbi:MAG: tetratricopeptide repeat protein [Terriglobales bacterium]